MCDTLVYYVALLCADRDRTVYDHNRTVDPVGVGCPSRAVQNGDCAEESLPFRASHSSSAQTGITAFVRGAPPGECPVWSITRVRLRTVWSDRVAYMCCYMILMCLVVLSLCPLAQLTLGGFLLIILAAAARFACNCLNINCPCSAGGRLISSSLSI